ncbi:Ig-like domain-containing protein [Paenibacillus sp. FSL R10-2734]|uniref:Ig-like domain-containing protein n=1 Tax=Paenibacillus sp. FSL R10-2734 TaxID=2954691 RepID=UPI0030DDDE8B
MKKIKRIALFSLVVMLFISCFTIGQAQAANANDFNGVGTSFADGLDAVTQKRLAEAPRTVEAWIKVPANLPNGQRIGVILGNYFDNYYDDISRFNFEINQNSNPRIYWKSGLGNPIDYVATNVNVKTGDWMHLAITLDEVGNKAVTYVNGEKMHEEQFKVPLPKDRTAREMKIGSDYRGYTNGKPSMKFNGELADVRVWSTVRTAEEIKNNYNVYLQGDKANLMGNWKLATQIDGKYLDSSLEQNHVTLYNEETTNWLDGEFPEGDYSIAIIPDTQYLVRYHQEAYMKHINWIKENAEKLKIKLAIQVGDLVDEPNNTEQWGVSSTGMRMLDGVVPYVFSPGNHDMILGKSTLTRDTTKYNQFYPYSKYSAEPAFSGAYQEGKMDNTYSKFNINGVRYMVLAMEFAPNDAVLAWADQVISKNQDRKVIISTHSYMYHSGEQISTRHKDYPSKDIDDGNNGDDMWNKLVSKYENIVLVTSGHIGYPDIVTREDIGEHGNTVQQVLADAQYMTADLGMIMLMTFKKGSNNVDVNWYSVTKEKFYRASNQFSMELNLYDGSEPDPESTPIELTTEDHSVKKGELVTVPITVSQASKMTGVEGVVQYDKELLTLESFEFVEFKENESHNASIAGKVSFAGIAQRAIGTDENTVIANLTFRAKADVTGEQETIISFFNVQAIEKGAAGQAVFVPTTAVGSKITLSGKAIRDLFDQKTFNIMVKHSSLNMDVDGGSYNNGAKIIQWSKGQGVNQQWTFIKTDPGYYKIVSQHSSKVLAVQNASMENGATIVQQEYSEDESYFDEWSVLEIENGYYQLINRASGKVTGISNGSTGGGTSFTQSENISADYQKFILSLDRRINHDWTGTGQNQLEYSSGWGSWDTHYSNTKDANVTLRFTGTQVKLYGAKGKDQGIVAISIDGGSETLVDAYASSRQDGQLLFESPTMTNKEHVLKIRVTGTKNEGATNTYFTLNYIDLFSRVDRLVESIAITTMDEEITTEGGTLQFEATVLPENAVNKDIIWSVFETDGSATDKATISRDGLLTAVKNGEVKVVATAAVGIAANSGSVVDEKIIVISGQKLVNSITVVSETGATEITKKGGSLQLKAEAEPAEAANKSVTWSVYEADGITVTTKATISESGLLTAVKDGAVKVVATATDGSAVIGSKVITISGQSNTPDPDPVKIKSITVTSPVDTITTKAGTLQLGATVLPEDAANKAVTWSLYEKDGTTATDKVTISESGVLTAVKNGAVKVVATATDGSGVFGSKVITISGQSNTPDPDPVKIKSITVTSPVDTITTKAGTLQLGATVLPEDAANKAVTWSLYEKDGTTATDKVTISESGVLTAVKNGAVKVVATATDGSGVFGSKVITISGQSNTPDPDPVKIKSITVTSPVDTITTKAGTLQLGATVLPEDAANKAVTWSLYEKDGTTATDKVTISESGVLTAVKNGVVKVVATATDGSGVFGSKIITISGQSDTPDPDPLMVESIAVTSPVDTITSKAGTLQMGATVLPEDAANKSVTWSLYEADGTTVTTKATISESGLLAAVKDGAVKIVATATDGSAVIGSKVVTISGQSNTPDPDPVKVKSITVTSPVDTITSKAGTLQMGATVLPEDAANKSVTWSVYEADGTTVTTKATISESGLLAAVKDGAVKIVATATDGSTIIGSKVVAISGQSTSGGGNGNSGGNNVGGNNGGSTTEPSFGDPTVYESKGSELKVDAANNTVKAQLNAEAFMKKIQAFEKAGKNAGSVLSIKVSGSYAGFEIEIPAEAISRLADSKPDAVIEVTSPIGSYAWPVSELAGEGLDLNGQVNVRIEQADRTVQKVLEEKLVGSGTRLRGAVVSYGAELKEKDATTELTPAGYVERTLILDGVVSNPNEATVMKYDPVTGELRFVPAVFTLKDGKTVATIQHNENGLYVIVEGKKTFDDMIGHWAQKDVETLASKLIINGMTDRTFAPAGQVTRAQFAALLVRGLGLTTESLSNAFADVSATAWYAQDVNTAAKLGLVQGVGEDKFIPEAMITREQMIVMIMKAIHLVQGDHGTEAQIRNPFADQDRISDYASNAVTEAAGKGLIKGKTETTFAPQDAATRAEAAVMIKQVLQYLKFMN